MAPPPCVALMGLSLVSLKWNWSPQLYVQSIVWPPTSAVGFGGVADERGWKKTRRQFSKHYTLRRRDNIPLSTLAAIFRPRFRQIRPSFAQVLMTALLNPSLKLAEIIQQIIPRIKSSAWIGASVSLCLLMIKIFSQNISTLLSPGGSPIKWTLSATFAGHS